MFPRKLVPTWSTTSLRASASRLQRQSAGRGRLSEVKDIAKRQVVRRAGEWWHGPNPEHGTCHGTLQSDRQDAPPATRPSLRRRHPQRGWRAPGPEAQELTEELMALITPATANFRSQDDQFLWAPPCELGIARGLAPTCCSERNPIAGICAGDRRGSRERRASRLRTAPLHSSSLRRPQSRGDGGHPAGLVGLVRASHSRTKPRRGSSAGAGEVVVPKPIDLPPAARATVPTALPVCQRQGQPQAAPQCQVHKVRARVVAAFVGMAESHMPAAGPDWDRRSAREAGGMAGSSSRSRKKV